MPDRAAVMFSTVPVPHAAGFQGSLPQRFPATFQNRFVVPPLRCRTGPKLINFYAAALDVKRDRGHSCQLGFHRQWPDNRERSGWCSMCFSARDMSRARAAPAGFWTAAAALPKAQ